MRNGSRSSCVLMLVWLYTFPYDLRPPRLQAPPRSPRTREKAAQLAKIDRQGRATAAERTRRRRPSPRMKAAGADPKAPVERKGPQVELIAHSKLVLGSADRQDAGRLSPPGAARTEGGRRLVGLASSRYDAEFKDGNFEKRPLQLIEPDPLWPASLSPDPQPERRQAGRGSWRPPRMDLDPFDRPRCRWRRSRTRSTGKSGRSSRTIRSGSSARLRRKIRRPRPRSTARKSSSGRPPRTAWSSPRPTASGRRASRSRSRSRSRAQASRGPSSTT